MPLVLRFFNVFLHVKKSKNVTFYVFLFCCIRFLELWFNRISVTSY